MLTATIGTLHLIHAPILYYVITTSVLTQNVNLDNYLEENDGFDTSRLGSLNRAFSAWFCRFLHKWWAVKDGQSLYPLCTPHYTLTVPLSSRFTGTAFTRASRAPLGGGIRRSHRLRRTDLQRVWAAVHAETSPSRVGLDRVPGTRLGPPPAGCMSSRAAGRAVLSSSLSHVFISACAQSSFHISGLA